MEQVISWAHMNANNRRIVALVPAVAGALHDAGRLALNPLHFLGAIDPDQDGVIDPSSRSGGQELDPTGASGSPARSHARRNAFLLSDSDEDGA